MYIAVSEHMFLCYTDENLPALIEKYSKILNPKFKN